jgi:hypothetical protein
MSTIHAVSTYQFVESVIPYPADNKDIKEFGRLDEDLLIIQEWTDELEKGELQASSSGRLGVLKKVLVSFGAIIQRAQGEEECHALHALRDSWLDLLAIEEVLSHFFEVAKEGIEAYNWSGLAEAIQAVLKGTQIPQPVIEKEEGMSFSYLASRLFLPPLLLLDGYRSMRDSFSLQGQADAFKRKLRSKAAHVISLLEKFHPIPSENREKQEIFLKKAEQEEVEWSPANKKLTFLAFALLQLSSHAMAVSQRESLSTLIEREVRQHRPFREIQHTNENGTLRFIYSKRGKEMRDLITRQDNLCDSEIPEIQCVNHAQLLSRGCFGYALTKILPGYQVAEFHNEDLLGHSGKSMLLDEYFTPVADPQPEDLVVYSLQRLEGYEHDFGRRHFGIYLGSNFVESKWGRGGGVFRHPLFYLPPVWADTATFYRLKPGAQFKPLTK